MNKQNYESNRQIIIMGIISIFFSLLTGAPNMQMLLIICFIPLVSSVLFIITKHPVFGIICTAFFFFNRIAAFTRGTLLSTIIILGITAYFVYVDYLSICDRKQRKADKRENRD